MILSSPLLVILSVIGYGFIHSLTASLWAKARAKKLLGETADRYYRLAYNIFSVISFLPVLGVVMFLPDQSLYSVPAPWLYLMLGVQLLALMGLIAGVLQTDVWHFLGVRQLISPPGSVSRLVVSGFYRWVRHPLYTASLVFIWLLPVMTANRMALNLGLTGYVIVGAFLEERKLLLEFGEAYQEYRSRTSMLLPWRRPV